MVQQGSRVVVAVVGERRKRVRDGRKGGKVRDG